MVLHLSGGGVAHASGVGQKTAFGGIPQSGYHSRTERRFPKSPPIVPCSFAEVVNGMTGAAGC